MSSWRIGTLKPNFLRGEGLGGLWGGGELGCSGGRGWTGWRDRGPRGVAERLGVAVLGAREPSLREPKERRRKVWLGSAPGAGGF